jgi:hypothetical protein
MSEAKTEKRHAYNVSVGKPEEKNLIGRPRYTYEYNIKKCFSAIKWKYLDQTMNAETDTSGGLL